MNREERKEFRREAFAEKYGNSRTLYSREEWLKRRPPEQSSECTAMEERLRKAIRQYEKCSKMLFASTCIYVVLIAVQLIKDIASDIIAMPEQEQEMFIVSSFLIVISVFLITLSIVAIIEEKKDMPDLMKALGRKEPKTIMQWIRHLFLETCYSPYVLVLLTGLITLICSGNILISLALRCM